MNNILDLRMKLIEKMIIEWIDSMDCIDPEEVCLRIEELREEITKGA